MTLSNKRKSSISDTTVLWHQQQQQMLNESKEIDDELDQYILFKTSKTMKLLLLTKANDLDVNEGTLIRKALEQYLQ